jgi:spoIIIJ-associated protein
MRKVTVSGKTVEEAVSLALKQLGTTKDRVTIKILEEPSKGLFGLIGSKPAKVEVEKKIDPIEEGQQFLKDIMDQMGVQAQIEIFKRDEAIYFNLVGKDIGILIGRRGQTLDSLQYLVNAVVNRYTDHYLRIILDAERYREKRKEALEELAVRLARKVAKTKQSIKLEPMSALERKIIHTRLQEDRFVETHSEGEEPYRYLVISYRHKKVN